MISAALAIAPRLKLWAVYGVGRRAMMSVTDRSVKLSFFFRDRTWAAIRDVHSPMMTVRPVGLYGLVRDVFVVRSH